MDWILITSMRVCIVGRMNIGNRLDQAMKAARIKSQSELSRLSGVPQATISRILKDVGAKGPETDTIKKLAKACKVSFAWLNEGDGPQYLTSITDNQIPSTMDTRIADALKIMQQMPDYKLDQIIKIIDVIADPASIEQPKLSSKQTDAGRTTK